MDTYKKTSTGWEVDNDGFNLLANNSKYLTKKFNIEEVKKEEVNEDGWSEVSTLPYNFWGGAAVVLDNEIHILGGSESYYKHYKYYSNQYLKEVTPFKSRYIKTANGWQSIATVEETYNKINEKIKENPMKIVKID